MYIFYNPTLTLTLTLTLSLTLPDHTPTKPFSAPFKKAAKCATRDGWEMDRAHTARQEGRQPSPGSAGTGPSPSSGCGVPRNPLPELSA